MYLDTCLVPVYMSVSVIFTKLGCSLILWRPGLALLIGKLCQVLTELSAHHMIVAGYCHFTFLLLFEKNPGPSCSKRR